MKSSLAQPARTDGCGPTTGNVVTTAPGQLPAAAGADPLTARVRATWTSGDFGRIAVGFADGAAAFVDRLSIRKNDIVLDVACGTGNLTIPAARHGATVVGIDIAPNLLKAAEAESARQRLRIRFDEGNAEQLPYDDASFSVVMSMFGVMFAPRAERATAELFRVAEPGGRIALANWTPGGFIGSMLRTVGAAVPPPAGVPSVLDWGNEDIVQSRFAPYMSRVRDLRLIRRRITLAFPTTPEGVVELFRDYYGPTVRAFGALDAEGQSSLFVALVNLWASHNTQTGGSTAVDAEYLDVEVDLV